MPEFQIKLKEMQKGYISIKAKNLAAARIKALKLIDNYGFDLQNSNTYIMITDRDVSLI